MPIHVKRDIQKKYGLQLPFSLKDIPDFKSGSVLGRVRNDIANANFDDLLISTITSINTMLHLQRDLTRFLGTKFNLNSQADQDAYNLLWQIASDSREWASDNALVIDAEVESSYGEIAFIAQGGASQKDSFKRQCDLSNKDVVVFSDFHMTALKNSPNYFDDLGNYDLYLKILRHYLNATNFTIVENGDVEDCLVYEPTVKDATDRLNSYDKKKLPIQANGDWKDFNAIRHAKRVTILNDIIDHYKDYYDLLTDEIIPSLRYVRITGNHDTYLNNELKDIIESRLSEGTVKNFSVYDVLRVNWNNRCKYVITHGHQFDEACLQPYAASIGEIITECVSWAYQGADRAWQLSDTKQWYNSEQGDFINTLSSSVPNVKFEINSISDFSLQNMRDNAKYFFETLLGHPIAWEYFENNDTFNAVFLEVYNGDEMYKLRHLNEINLYNGYTSRFGMNEVPILVVGHSHEVRNNASRTIGNSIFTSPSYINTGSAGRFANLIWCAELTGNDQHIVSWSEVDGKLKKITWKNQKGVLKHDTVTWIDL